MKIFSFKDGYSLFNSSVVQFMVKKLFSIQLDSPDENTDTVSEPFLRQVSQTGYFPAIDNLIE